MKIAHYFWFLKFRRTLEPNFNTFSYLITIKTCFANFNSASIFSMHHTIFIRWVYSYKLTVYNLVCKHFRLTEFLISLRFRFWPRWKYIIMSMKMDKLIGIWRLTAFCYAIKSDQPVRYKMLHEVQWMRFDAKMLKLYNVVRSDLVQHPDTHQT